MKFNIYYSSDSVLQNVSTLNNNKKAGLTARKYQYQVAWRRNKVKELFTHGCTQHEIAQQLHISQSTVSRDLKYIEKELAKSRKNYGQRLFSDYESTMLGYNEIIKKLRSIVDSKTNNNKERLKAISLLSHYYQKRMDLIKSEYELLESKRLMGQMRIVDVDV